MRILYNILPFLFLPIIGFSQKTIFDLYPGRVSSGPCMFTEYKDKLYFYAKDSAKGGELWAIDSAIGGPSLVADIYPGPLSSFPLHDLSYLTGNGVTFHSRTLYYAAMAVAYSEYESTDVLFFMANDGVHGFELYKYTGNGAPSLEKEFIPGPTGISQYMNYDMDTIAGDVYILLTDNVSNELWKYNIHARTLKQIDKGLYKDIFSITSYKGKLYFTARVNQYPLRPIYVWCYDPVADTVTKAFNSIDSWGNIQEVGGKLYFVSENRTILFEYDGTNTPRIVDANTYPTKRCFDDYGMYKGKLYYPGIYGHPYAFDPVTGISKEAFKVDTSIYGASLASSFIQYRDKMYFNGTGDSRNGPRYQLWEWDGVNPPQETWRLNFKFIGAQPHNFHIVGGALYFVAEGTQDYHDIGWELYKYVSQPTGINNQLNNDNHVIIYPNPTTNDVVLALDLKESQALTIEVLSSDGRKVIELPNTLYSKGNSRITVNTSQLPSGTYYCRAVSHQGKQIVNSTFVKL